MLAAKYLEEALRGFPGTGKPEQRVILLDAYAKAEAQVGKLSIRTSPDRASIYINSAIIGATPFSGPQFVEAGRHRIEAKQGNLTASSVIDIRGGQEQEVFLTLAGSSAPPTRADDGESARSPWPLAVIIGGASVAAVGLGVGHPVHTARPPLLETRRRAATKSGVLAANPLGFVVVGSLIAHHLRGGGPQFQLFSRPRRRREPRNRCADVETRGVGGEPPRFRRTRATDCRKTRTCAPSSRSRSAGACSRRGKREAELALGRRVGRRPWVETMPREPEVLRRDDLPTPGASRALQDEQARRMTSDPALKARVARFLRPMDSP